MIDYHIHPDYSIDAEPFSMHTYCEQALLLGLREICFTTHCEFDILRQELDWYVRCRGNIVPMHPAEWLEYYFEDALKCREIFKASGLSVKVGLEAGYDLGLDEQISRVVDSYPFDFVIGSVHCLDHCAISSGRESMDYYTGKKLTDIAGSYYKTLIEAVKSGLFDVVGHLDIYRRHGARFFDPAINDIYREYINDVLKLMVSKGTGLELNTSSLRQGQGSFYPTEGILKEALRVGVKNFTIGSDCHRIEDLAQGVYHGLELGKAMGIDFKVYEKRVPKTFKFSDTDKPID